MYFVFQYFNPFGGRVLHRTCGNCQFAIDLNYSTEERVWQFCIPFFATTVVILLKATKGKSQNRISLKQQRILKNDKSESFLDCSIGTPDLTEAPDMF